MQRDLQALADWKQRRENAQIAQPCLSSNLTRLLRLEVSDGPEPRNDVPLVDESLGGLRLLQ